MHSKPDIQDEKIRLPFPVIGMAVCIGTLITLGAAAFITMHSYRQSSKTMHNYIIGNATNCGYIGVRITYDREPVDIILISPDGHKYTQDSLDIVYETDEEKKTIILMADSDKLGTWYAQFNTKSNKKIDYCLIELPSETLYITNPSIIIGDDGLYYLRIMATTSGNGNAKCNLILNKSGFSYSLTGSEIQLNEETDILLDFPAHAFTNEDYRLKINVSTEDGQSTVTEIKIHLNSRSQE